MPATTRPMLFDHLLALVLLCAAMPTIAAERHALIIGNAAYQGEAPLKNTLNDARDMARLLAGLGFEIAGDGPLENADRNTMARAINRFVSRVQGRDGIALIYYSGHGMRDRHDANYFIPTDAAIEQEPDVRAAGIALSGILDQLHERPRNAVSLLIVDACRNNPFAVGAKGGKRGLGRVDPARGSLVLYSASPGQQADDNRSGRNGLFTKHLLAELAQPGQDVEDAFDAVSLAVEDASGGAQIPWSGGNLRGKVYLAGGPSGLSRVAPPPPPLAVGYLQINLSAEGDVWVDGRSVGAAAPGRPLNLTNLTAGRHRVEARIEGSEVLSMEANVEAGRWAQLNLIPPPTVAAPVDRVEVPTEVVLEFFGPVWVDVRDASRKFKLFGEKNAGDRFVLEGIPPYDIVLGNVSAVRIEVNGEPFDLASRSKGNVARFKLDPDNAP